MLKRRTALRDNARALQGGRTSSRRWRICRSSSRARRSRVSHWTEGAPGNAQAPAAAIGLQRMMAVLSPASPAPKDERRKFVKERCDGDWRGAAAIADFEARPRVPWPDVFQVERQPAHVDGTRCPKQFRARRGLLVRTSARSAAGTGITRGGTTADILAAAKSCIVHIHVSEWPKPAPPEEVRQRVLDMPGQVWLSNSLMGFSRR